MYRLMAAQWGEQMRPAGAPALDQMPCVSLCLLCPSVADQGSAERRRDLEQADSSGLRCLLMHQQITMDADRRRLSGQTNPRSYLSGFLCSLRAYKHLVPG